MELEELVKQIYEKLEKLESNEPFGYFCLRNSFREASFNRMRGESPLEILRLSLERNRNNLEFRVMFCTPLHEIVNLMNDRKTGVHLKNICECRLQLPLPALSG
jgi:hypothetical protein